MFGTDLSDTKLSEKAASTIFPGEARAARYLLAVPEAARSVTVDAANLHNNTTPGWRWTDSLHLFVMAYERTGCTDAAEALLNRERERAARERALNADITKPHVLVDWDGRVREARVSF